MFLLEEMETDVVQSDAVFLEDVTGLMEATLDAEVSWNNIMMTAVNKEYTAIKNEDAALLEATQTDGGILLKNGSLIVLLNLRNSFLQLSRKLLTTSTSQVALLKNTKKLSLNSMVK